MILAIIIGAALPAYFVLSFKLVPLTANPLVAIVKCIPYGYPAKIAVLLILIVYCVLAYLVVKQWRALVYQDPLDRTITYSDTDSYGSARFAKEEEYREYAPVRKLSDCSGLVLGRVLYPGYDKVDKFIDFHPEANPLFNGNICVFGASGSGKSSCFVKPLCVQIMKRRESIVVSDPKGELYNETSEMFRANGYVVRVFDLIDFKKSDGWDPIKTITRTGREGLEARVEIFAYTMVNNMKDVKDIYKLAGISLLKSILFYIILSDDVPEDEKNMRTLKSMLSLQFPAFEAILDNCGGVTAPAKKAFDEFRVASDKLYGNIFVSIQTGTSQLGTEDIANILCTDDIDMTSPGKQPTIIYCRFSVTNNSYQFIIATFFAMMFEIMFAQAAQTKKITLPVHVHFILDEFANIGQLPDWAQKMSTIRSYNITAYMIVQDYTQFANNYPGTDVTIRGNCATWICMGLNDEVTAKLLSERVGEMTQEIRTSPENKLGQKKDQTNVGMGKRMFLSSTELHELDKYYALIIFQRKKPVLCRKAHISVYEDVKKYPVTSVQVRPNINDIDKRRQYRDEEERRITEYYREHPPVDSTPYDPEVNIITSLTEIADRTVVEIVLLAVLDTVKEGYKLLRSPKAYLYELFEVKPPKKEKVIVSGNKKKETKRVEDPEETPACEVSPEQDETVENRTESIRKEISLEELAPFDSDTETTPQSSTTEPPDEPPQGEQTTPQGEQAAPQGEQTTAQGEITDTNGSSDAKASSRNQAKIMCQKCGRPLSASDIAICKKKKRTWVCGQCCEQAPDANTMLQSAGNRKNSSKRSSPKAPNVIADKGISSLPTDK